MKKVLQKVIHEQELFELDDKRKILCDKSLVELIKALNNAGLITLNSCQGGNKFFINLNGKKVKEINPSYLDIDMRSVCSVSVDNDFLHIEWKLNNPRKNWKEILKLRKERQFCLKEYKFDLNKKSWD